MLFRSERHLKDSQAMINKILWSDEAKKYRGGSIMLWGCFSAAGTGMLVSIEEKMNGAKYREIHDKNLLKSAQDLRLE